MNSCITNNKQFFSLMVSLLLSSSLYGVTINNKPINEASQDGDTFIATDELEENTTVILEMEKGNLNIHNVSFNDKGIDELKKEFKYVCENRKGSFNTNNLRVASHKGDYRLSYLLARERIDFQLESSLNLDNCLVESPQVDIAAKKVKFQGCFFVNPHVLNIVTNSQDSDCEAIQIIFHKQPENPTVVSGKVNFKGKETKKRLIISNVKQVRFKFKPKA